MNACKTDEFAAHPKSTSTESVAPSTGVRRRVLIVDDEPTVLQVLKRVLATRHDVTAVGSVAELEHELDGAAHFDAILCDFGLTTADGTEASIMLLQRWPERAPRLAVLTGNPLSERVISFARTEVVRLIAKPIAVRALFDLVEELSGAWPDNDGSFDPLA